MTALWNGMLDALSRGERVALCTILASSGSTPRGAGSRMAVFADGTSLGTVGGGKVEFLAIEQAKRVLLSGVPAMKGFALSKGEIADIGMICGGSVTVYVQCFLPEDAAATAELARLCELSASAVNAWYIAKIEDGVMTDTALFDERNGLMFGNSITEQDVLPLLSSDAVLKAGEPAWYAEPVSARGTVYIFGCGHVGRELAPLLSHVGFRVVVYDERARLATRDAFPAAKEVICAPFDAIFDQITLTDADYAVVMTPGHEADYTVLEQVLRKPCSYVGCIGSRTKIAAVNAKLRAAGISDASIAAVHAPIGLNIGGRTPAEIAVSVAAEMIQHRAQHRT